MIDEYEKTTCDVCGERLADADGSVLQDTVVIGCLDLWRAKDNACLHLDTCIKDLEDGSEMCSATVHVSCLGNYVTGMLLSVDHREVRE